MDETYDQKLNRIIESRIQPTGPNGEDVAEDAS